MIIVSRHKKYKVTSKSCMAQLKRILMLGPEGCGKSLIIKRIQQILSCSSSTFLDVPPTIATVGTNLVRIVLDKKPFELREIGGALAPIWRNYLVDCEGILFVIDSSNMFQVAASCNLLMSILTEKTVYSVPVLVLLNKRDLCSSVEVAQIKYMFRLNCLCKDITRKTSVVDISCCDAGLFSALFAWLRHL